MRPLLAILRLWRARPMALASGVLVSLAALAAGLALMAASGRLVGAGGLAAAVAGGGLAMLAVRGLGPLRVVLRYFERLAAHDATFRLLADLRVWFFRGVARHAAGGLGYRRAGDLLSRLVADVEALDVLYPRVIVPLGGLVLLIPALLIGGATLGALVAILLLLLFLLAALALPWRGVRGALDLGGRIALASAALRVACVDTLSGLREVRAFGAEGRMLALVQARESALLAAQRELAWRAAVAQAGAFLCAQAALLVVLAAAGAHPLAAAMMALLVVAAFEAVGGLPRAGVVAGQAAAAAARIIDVAEGPPPVPEPAIPAAAPSGSALRFEGVHFAWAADRAPVFDGLTLDVPEGARVALLGPSGTGKSTLAALALKVAAPQSGRILLGGVDVAALAAPEVRRRIGWLSQATHLFDDTVRANLLLGRPDADEAALWTALETAQVADVVRALPDGLDAYLGEGAARLSGGQARRVALARTLLFPAPVLILDEPAAGLDAATERAFLTTLNEAASGRTVILIAHRLTGVERLDRIWRLSAGRAVAAAG